MKCGFVGLGAMGNPMCLNLLKDGIDLTVFDQNKAAIEKLVEKGAKAADSLEELSRKTEVIVFMLPDANVIQKVLDDVLKVEGKTVKTIMDMSSIGPESSKLFAAKAEEEGVCYFDAPVSGGIVGAEKGNLSIMTGCSEAVMKELEPLFKSMGENIYVLNNIGHGSAVKMINNYIAGVAGIAIGETMVMGKVLGLDLDVLLDIVNHSTGRTFGTEVYKSAFLDTRNFEKGFKLDLLYKDLGLSMETSRQLRIPLIMGAAAVQSLEMARVLGYGQENFYAAVKVMEQFADVEI